MTTKKQLNENQMINDEEIWVQTEAGIEVFFTKTGKNMTREICCGGGGA